MKPHIEFYRSISGYGCWHCWNDEGGAFGESILDAYETWKNTHTKSDECKTGEPP